jgi:DNA-binding PadR family transcriptional regulator
MRLRCAGMGRSAAQAFGLSATETVLGLLIERPANSYELEQRLDRRFGSARFGHGTAYHAVQRLAKQGLIRAVDPDQSALPGGAKTGGSSATTYEASTNGSERFARWLRASPSTPPVREELLAKIAFCGPADVPRLIEIIREAELACATRPEDLNGRLRTDRRPAGDDDWRRLMSMIVTAGDAAWWDARLNWLKTMRQHLQRERQRNQAERSGAPAPGA